MKLYIDVSGFSRGWQGEAMALRMLPGSAKVRNSSNKIHTDILWMAQDRKVEAKTLHIKSSDLGKKCLRADIRRNRGYSDYYFITMFIDNKPNRCYLIPAAEVENRCGSSIIMPQNWDNFKFKDYLYATIDNKEKVTLHM